MEMFFKTARLVKHIKPASETAAHSIVQEIIKVDGEGSVCWKRIVFLFFIAAGEVMGKRRSRESFA